MKRELNKRERIIVIVTSLVIFVGFFQYWYFPQNLKVKEMKTKLQTVMNSNLAQDALLKSMQIRQPASVENTSLLGPVSDYLESSQSLSQFIHALSEDPEKNHLKIHRITVDNPITIEGLNQNKIKVEVETSFLNLGRFLEKLEQSKLLVDIASVEVLRLTDDLRNCVARIDLYSYTQKGVTP